MYPLYSFLFTVTAILALPWYILMALGGRISLRGFNERFGAIAEFGKIEAGRIWIHASSVGEVGIASTLIKELTKIWPEKKFVLSTMTPAGKKIAEKSLSKILEGVFFVPFDWQFSVKRCLRSVKPDVLILVETEIWPNLVHQCGIRGIPVFMVNGRISKKSVSGYSLFTGILKDVFVDFRRFIMRSEEDAARIKALSAPEDKVVVAGNMKYDISVETDEATLKRLEAWKGGAVLLAAGSTLRGEEEILASVFKKLSEEGKNLKMILAPRHPERFDEAASILKSSEIKFIRRSSGLQEGAGAQVILLDTIGELAGIYAACDIAFIGGSLVPKGGHNILEPAFFGKPVIVGRHTDNFKEIVNNFEAEKAILQVSDETELKSAVSKLMEYPEERKRLGGSALSILVKNKGAVKRTAYILQRELG